MIHWPLTWRWLRMSGRQWGGLPWSALTRLVVTLRRTAHATCLSPLIIFYAIYLWNNYNIPYFIFLAPVCQTRGERPDKTEWTRDQVILTSHWLTQTNTYLWLVRREQEVRERARHHHQTQSGFDVTVRTTEAGGYTDEDTASMSEYTGQELIEPVLIDRHRGYAGSEMRSSHHHHESMSMSGRYWPITAQYHYSTLSIDQSQFSIISPCRVLTNHSSLMLIYVRISSATTLQVWCSHQSSGRSSTRSIWWSNLWWPDQVSDTVSCEHNFISCVLSVCSARMTDRGGETLSPTTPPSEPWLSPLRLQRTFRAQSLRSG